MSERPDYRQMQEYLDRQQWEAEQELLKADPDYELWLQQLETQHDDDCPR